MSNVNLISCSQGIGPLSGHSPQDIISYVARVSNPHNQSSFHTAAGLLKYCIKHQHWSIFETVSMTMEINTTRGIAAQILRHRSFTFQEFSQRYADTKLLSAHIDVPELRRQDTKNRQNSIDDIPQGLLKTIDERLRSISLTVWIFIIIFLIEWGGKRVRSFRSSFGLPYSALHDR